MPELAKFPAPVARSVALKVPQVRVLMVLLPDGDEPPLGTIHRFHLAEMAGFIPTTGTINRVLNGIVTQNCTSGAAHPGLLALGLVEKVVVDLDGMASDSYRITRAGIKAVREWLLVNKVPPKRDEKSCVNRRYVDDATSD